YDPVASCRAPRCHGKEARQTTCGDGEKAGYSARGDGEEARCPTGCKGEKACTTPTGSSQPPGST
ncbi:MAG: hypothetical protein KC502_09140, partial [Myxococcales bacterium]|nr:hypothetical protein [Myxococcales bacterium]